MYSADHPFLFGKWKMPFRTRDLIVITFALLKVKTAIFRIYTIFMHTQII